MRRSVLLSPFLVLVAGIVLAGCTTQSPSATPAPAPAASQAPATQAAKAPVKIGLIGPFTGPAKENGQMLFNNMKFAIKQTNDAGGILGGRKVEYIIFDDQADPVQAAAVTQKAITVDKVAAMVGTWETSAAKAYPPGLIRLRWYRYLCRRLLRPLPYGRFTFSRNCAGSFLYGNQQVENPGGRL
jgi:hypothetical protein